MCDFRQGFRLCTCSDQPLDPYKPHWILQRVHPEFSDKLVSLFGECSNKADYWYDKSEQEAILDALHNKSAFDFEYYPKEEDVLILQDNRRSCRLTYSKLSGWYFDGFTQPVPYVNLLKGNIDSPFSIYL